MGLKGGGSIQKTGPMTRISALYPGAYAPGYSEDIWVIRPNSYIPLSTICMFLAGGALLWPRVLHVRF